MTSLVKLDKGLLNDKQAAIDIDETVAHIKNSDNLCDGSSESWPRFAPHKAQKPFI